MQKNYYFLFFVAVKKAEHWKKVIISSSFLPFSKIWTKMIYLKYYLTNWLAHSTGEEVCDRIWERSAQSFRGKGRQAVKTIFTMCKCKESTVHNFTERCYKICKEQSQTTTERQWPSTALLHGIGTLWKAIVTNCSLSLWLQTQVEKH